MALDVAVGLDPSHIVLDGDPAPLPKKGTEHPPNFRPIFIVAIPGDFVFDGDPATPRTEGTPTTAQFLAHVYCGQTAG